MCLYSSSVRIELSQRAYVEVGVGEVYAKLMDDCLGTRVHDTEEGPIVCSCGKVLFGSLVTGILMK